LIAAALLVCAVVVRADDDEESEEHQKEVAKAEKCKCLWDAEDTKIANTCGLEAHQQCTQELIELGHDIDVAKEDKATKVTEELNAVNKLGMKKKQMQNEQADIKEKIRIIKEKKVEAETQKTGLLAELAAKIKDINDDYDPKIKTALEEKEAAKAEMDRLQAIWFDAVDSYSMAVACNDNNKEKLFSKKDGKKEIKCPVCTGETCENCAAEDAVCTQQAATKRCQWKIEQHHCTNDVCVNKPDVHRVEDSTMAACQTVCSDKAQSEVSEYKTLCANFNKAPKPAK